MTKYRENLPLTLDEIFLTDGGLETTLIFEKGFDLPEFAAFTLLNQTKGYQVLHDYYLPYITIAKQKGLGFILESPTWRASRAWGEKLGFDSHDLRRVNQTSISMLKELRDEFEDQKTKMVISGCIGPKGDGYEVNRKLSIAMAKEYHLEQIATLKETDADLVSAYTINYMEEAAGIVLAAKSIDMPVVISFTTEVDGTLPSGQSLKKAIEQVETVSGNYPVYYMINCAHPTHFSEVLDSRGDWVKRIRAIRANASCKSHTELDEMVELDKGDTVELSVLYKNLKTRLPNLNIFGGCCGTDHHHIHEITLAIQ